MKLFLKIFLIISLIFANIFVYADGENTENEKITYKATEKLPWMKCWEPEILNEWLSSETKVYDCEVKPGMESLMWIISWAIKYFTYIALVSAVLFIVINGIMYSMSWIDSGMKDEAKKRITKTLWWIVLLFLSGYILNLLFPWIYK